jgi:hypothetical protein
VSLRKSPTGTQASRRLGAGLDGEHIGVAAVGEGTRGVATLGTLVHRSDTPKRPANRTGHAHRWVGICRPAFLVYRCARNGANEAEMYQKPKRFSKYVGCWLPRISLCPADERRTRAAALLTPRRERTKPECFRNQSGSQNMSVPDRRESASVPADGRKTRAPGPLTARRE